MKIKISGYAFLLLLLAGFTVTIIAYYWFVGSAYYPAVIAWASQNVLVLDIILFVVKVVGIIWPPLPGIVLSLAAIPVLGWVHVFLVDSLGNLVGCIVTYWLARKWGLPFLGKVVDMEALRRFQRIQTIEKREVEGLVILRIFGSTVAEVTSYGAGLMRVRFGNFLVAIILSNFIVGIPLFYFTDRLFRGDNYLLAFVPVLVVVLLFYVLRKRYFRTV